MSDNSSTGTAISSNTGGTLKSLELFSLGPVPLPLLFLRPLLPLLPYVPPLPRVKFRLIFGFLSCESTPCVEAIVLVIILAFVGVIGLTVGDKLSS